MLSRNVTYFIEMKGDETFAFQTYLEQRRFEKTYFFNSGRELFIINIPTKLCPYGRILNKGTIYDISFIVVYTPFAKVRIATVL